MKSAIKNLLIVTLPTLVIIFIILEVFLRVAKTHFDLDTITGKVESENPMGIWAKPDPYSAYTGKSGIYSEGKTVNSKGFISTPEISLEKQAGTIRILFLGGSSTAGTGHNLPDQETWPWKVASLVKERTGKEVDFINAALGGYTTFESYGKLWSRLQYYQPDIVVVYHGWNELYYFNEEITEDPTKWRDGYSILTPKALVSVEPHWIDPLVSWSQLLSRVRYKLIHQRPVSGGEVGVNPVSDELATDFAHSALDIFANNLKLFRQHAELHGYHLFVCKQATLITSQTSSEDRKKCMYSHHGFDHNAHVAAYDGIYKVIDDNLPPASIIDVASISGISECFIDHVHPTELGTTRIAEIVTDSLLNNYFNIKL